ncbi:MAG: histidine kinase [Pseudomonadota bacterium]
MNNASMTSDQQDTRKTIVRRLLFTFGFATLIGILNVLPSHSPTLLVLGRVWLVGVFVLLAFSLFERWPRQLPSWLARWVLQLLGILVVVPMAALLAYWITTGGNFAFLKDQQRLQGFGFLTVTGILFAPWIALGAMVRQREAFARRQQLSFALERSELERQALDARMRLLQAQVQPHFLFNTLANVQALVDTGSPKASQVLGTLIAYLRAAVPLLDAPFSTLQDELALVRSYLELMHMRMPDRLQFTIGSDPEALLLRCPPLTLLTLVENAVRHGIDPGEKGGRIDIDVRLSGQQCRVRVSDTGIGLRQTSGSLGTGLSTLRERLLLSFGSGAELHLTEVQPHGVRVELKFPAQRITG